MNLKNTLTEEGLEEFRYIINTKSGFPTYKCPFKDSCSINLESYNSKWKNRDKCLECKEKFLNKYKKLL